jgi:hypothetical protein
LIEGEQINVRSGNVQGEGVPCWGKNSSRFVAQSAAESRQTHAKIKERVFLCAFRPKQACKPSPLGLPARSEGEESQQPSFLPSERMREGGIADLRLERSKQTEGQKRGGFLGADGRMHGCALLLIIKDEPENRNALEPLVVEPLFLYVGILLPFFEGF